MPVRSNIKSATPTVPGNGNYPKLLQGDSGAVWLITAPKTGVVVHASNRPQKAKHVFGYTSTKMVETKMREFKGELTLAA